MSRLWSTRLYLSKFREALISMIRDETAVHIDDAATMRACSFRWLLSMLVTRFLLDITELIAACMRIVHAISVLIFSFSLLPYGVGVAFGMPRQAEAVRVQPSNDDSIELITVGFGNSARLGHWTPIAVSFKDPAIARQIVRIDLTCPDGDDAPITYDNSITASDSKTLQAQFRLGRPRGDLVVRILGADDREIAVRTFQIGDSSGQVRPLRATSKIIVAIGDVVEFRSPDEINDAPQNDLGVHFIREMPPQHLPRDWNGYRGVDTVVFSATDSDQLAKLDDRQLTALNEWVKSGGKLVIWTSSTTAKELQTGGRLSGFGKFPSATVAKIKRLSVVERFVDANVPIPVKEDISFIDVGNMTLTPLVTQDGLVMVGRYSHGFGLVTFSAVALNQSPFAEWKPTASLLEKLVLINRQGTDADEVFSSSRLIDNGYRDLAGQLRVPLESFRSVELVSFTAVAVLIALFAMLIGPGDYFLLRGAGRRMHWTWMTFPFFVALFCGLTWWLNQTLKSDQIKINLFELVDIDASNSRVSGRVWAGIYSPDAREVDADLQVENPLWKAPDYQELTWMGQPGSGLGGMQITTPPLTATAGYQNLLARQGDQSKWRLEGFPLSFSSVRTATGVWNADSQFKATARLKRTRRLDRLEGQINNPFEFTLMNPRLFYGDSVFTIERNLEPGDAADVFTEMKEITIKNYFAGRTGDATKEGAKAQIWNPKDTNENRIMQLAMFHELVGGRSYSGLSNGYLDYVEVSDRLVVDRAILMGEVSVPFSELTLNGQVEQGSVENRMTIIRLFLPVEIETTKSESKN
jgi:hypothetical protein